MSLITWHGIGPWHKTGYGLMTDLFTERIRDLGHQVVIAVMGERGARNPLNHPDAAEAKRTGLWKGMRVIGPGMSEFTLPPQSEMRRAHGGEDPDLIIVLKDAWVLDPEAYYRYPRTVVWLAFDCDPMGQPDRDFFARAPMVGGECTSLWGQARAREAGMTGAGYIPPGIDMMDVWTPGDRAGARELLKLPGGAFIAGIDAANIGPRKGWGEQLSAFARAAGPDWLLMIHAAPKNDKEGLNLRHLAFALGLNKSPDEPVVGDRVVFGSQNNMTQAQMVNWYRCLDVLMQGSYGEGYGLPIVQAHACGIPVIGTDCSAISEKIPPGTGWLVKGQRWWNPHHQAWWTIPSVDGLTGALRKAAAGRHAKPELIREHALQYDAGLITAQYWEPLIKELCDG